MQVRNLPEAVAWHCAKLVKLQLLRPGYMAPCMQKGPTASAGPAPGTAKAPVPNNTSMILRMVGSPQWAFFHKFQHKPFRRVFANQ
jgi:hypothetical protein